MSEEQHHEADVAEARGAWGPRFTRTVEWYLPQPTAETLAMSGLDYLRGVAEGRLAPPAISGVAAIEELSAEVGEVVLKATPDGSWLNPNGNVHGGWMCTLLDSAMGLALTSTVDSLAVVYSSIELKVSFLKAVPTGGAIEFRGRTLRVGRRVAFAEAHARNADGALVGHATSSLARVQ